MSVLNSEALYQANQSANVKNSNRRSGQLRLVRGRQGVKVRTFTYPGVDRIA